MTPLPLPPLPPHPSSHLLQSIRLTQSQSQSHSPSLSLKDFHSVTMPLSRSLRPTSSPYAPNYTSSKYASDSTRSSPGPSHPANLFEDLYQSHKHSSSSGSLPSTPSTHSRPSTPSKTLLPPAYPALTASNRSHSASPRLPVATIISLYNAPHSLTRPNTPSLEHLTVSSPPTPPPRKDWAPSLTSSPGESARCYEITLSDCWLGQQLKKPPPLAPRPRAGSSASSSAYTSTTSEARSPLLCVPTFTPALTPEPSREFLLRLVRRSEVLEKKCYYP